MPTLQQWFCDNIFCLFCNGYSLVHLMTGKTAFMANNLMQMKILRNYFLVIIKHSNKMAHSIIKKPEMLWDFYDMKAKNI